GLPPAQQHCESHRRDGALAPPLMGMVIHAKQLPLELLRLAGLEHEPVVMLESVDRGALVRKLTPVEKNDYSEQTGENAFFGTEQEFDEAILAIRHDDSPNDVTDVPPLVHVTDVALIGAHELRL